MKRRNMNTSECLDARYIASFPGHPSEFHHLQYAYTRGKAWENWSHVMTSGRQMVDARGAVPSEGS